MAKYQEAISWIALNDDTDWVKGEPESGSGSPSVTAALVADLFGKPVQIVRRDIIRALGCVCPECKATGSVKSPFGMIQCDQCDGSGAEQS